MQEPRQTLAAASAGDLCNSLKEASRMWHNMRVSVILPTYNEKDSIRDAIEQFFDTGLVD